MFNTSSKDVDGNSVWEKISHNSQPDGCSKLKKLFSGGRRRMEEFYFPLKLLSDSTYCHYILRKNNIWQDLSKKLFPPSDTVSDRIEMLRQELEGTSCIVLRRDDEDP